VVYKLTLEGDQWFQTTIYNFKGDKDGGGPGSRVVFDAAGRLFGSTPNGGTHSAGTIFMLTVSPSGAWHKKTIHNFTGGKDGATGSMGDLLFDAAGSIYGVTEQGGANGVGTVYKLSPLPNGGWKLTTLYAFKGMPDAANPYVLYAASNLGSLIALCKRGGIGVGGLFELLLFLGGRWLVGSGRFATTTRRSSGGATSPSIPSRWVECRIRPSPSQKAMWSAGSP